MYTNVDNGKFVTSAERSVSKDLKVIDNGDGTLTIIVLATGSAVRRQGNWSKTQARSGSNSWWPPMIRPTTS